MIFRLPAKFSEAKTRAYSTDFIEFLRGIPDLLAHVRRFSLQTEDSCMSKEFIETTMQSIMFTTSAFGGLRFLKMTSGMVVIEPFLRLISNNSKLETLIVEGFVFSSRSALGTLLGFRSPNIQTLCLGDIDRVEPYSGLSFQEPDPTFSAFRNVFASEATQRGTPTVVPSLQRLSLSGRITRSLCLWMFSPPVQMDRPIQTYALTDLRWRTYTIDYDDFFSARQRSSIESLAVNTDALDTGFAAFNYPNLLSIQVFRGIYLHDVKRVLRELVTLARAPKLKALHLNLWHRETIMSGNYVGIHDDPAIRDTLDPYLCTQLQNFGEQHHIDVTLEITSLDEPAGWVIAGDFGEVFPKTSRLPNVRLHMGVAERWWE
ncbi:hypothetical protein VNI00_013120 [Paramarasmius palmivorus]|uniref:Uncharacterized protein n=1 Tax=Paramarasmius palmivorus TaxID=297713 RepID=A0AAW0C2K7_9AGAR